MPHAPDPPYLRRDGRATMHGTAIDRGGRGLLLLGPSGAGKSGLAAEMVLTGARLVADDMLLLELRDGEVWVTGLEATEGREDVQGGAATRPIELRGIGIVRVPATCAVAVRGVMQLEPSPERLPEGDGLILLGVRIPLVRHPARAGAAAKALLWLAAGPAITASR